MRYIIHGAGAVGSLIGGHLAESGAEVALIGRPAHINAINERGLLIRSKNGDRRVKGMIAVTSPRDLASRADDVILLTVKGAQTADSAKALRQAFGEQVPIFCLQNGTRNEELAARRFRRVYGAMVGLSVMLLEPGVIAHTQGRHIAIGNYPLGCDETAVQVARQFEQAGFKVSRHENVMAVKWSKLIANLNNALLAIIDCYLQLARVTPRISRFMVEIEEEGLHVLKQVGISVEEPNNPFNFPARHAQMRSVVEDAEAIRQAESLPFYLRAYPSTWVDLKQKKGETEAGYFNGEIVLLGERNGIPTPYNSTLLNVLGQMITRGQGPGAHTLDELIELVEQKRRKIYQE